MCKVAPTEERDLRESLWLAPRKHQINGLQLSKGSRDVRSNYERDKKRIIQKIASALFYKPMACAYKGRPCTALVTPYLRKKEERKVGRKDTAELEKIQQTVRGGNISIRQKMQ